MLPKYITLTSILSDVQDSVYQVNKQNTKGVVVKNAMITLRCFVDNSNETEDVLIYLPDPSQSTDKEFKDTTLSEIKFSFITILTEEADSNKPDIPKNTTNDTKFVLDTDNQTNNNKTQNFFQSDAKHMNLQEHLSKLLSNNQKYNIEF